MGVWQIMSSFRSVSFPAWPRLASTLAFIFSLVLIEAEVSGQKINPEVEALLEFKASSSVQYQTGTGGVAYQPRGFWDSWKETDDTPCSWVGVTCTADGRVQGIDVSGWGLEKQFGFASLSGLERLEEFDVSSNQFEDTINDDIGTLSGLVRLDLSDSTFDGEIPTALNQLQNLRSLSLAGNRLSGEIPRLDNLSKLQVLSLARNELTGSIPQHLGRLSSLVTLDLSSNMLTGAIPVLRSFTNLLDMNLNNNKLTKFADPRFPAPKNLKHLFISGNQLASELPSGLVDLVDLEVLDLSSNAFSGTIPMGLSRQTNHSFRLDLSRNQLTGGIPEDLFLPSGQFAAMSLNLSSNFLTGGIPVTQQNGRLWYDLLDLSNNLLEGPIPPIFAGSFNDSFDFEIRSRTHILNLHNNLLTGDIVDLLNRGFTETRELRLENNLFTGDLTRLIGGWGGMWRLKVVDLSRNRLHMRTTKEYPDPLRDTLEEFGKGVTLREFRIGGNKLDGISLPKSFLRVPPYELEVLDLSNLGLVGEIKTEAFDINQLQVLKVLNISGNNLTGPIPLNLTLLPNLTTLDVSRNNFSGALPAIPRGSNLWNANFFAENPNLCDGPLRPCSSPNTTLSTTVFVEKGKTSWWLLLIVVSLSVLVPVISCLILAWRWRVYKRKHQQDADLIATLIERDTATVMPLSELRKATGNFAESAQIGVGGFGTVYTGKLIDGTVVAIKRSKRGGSEEDKQHFLNEVKILSQVNHRHLVRLLGCCMENKTSLLVFEFVSNGTLQEHLQGKIAGPTLNWRQRLHIAIQTADALNYLHSAVPTPIYHRDLKTASILLDEKLNAKVADFGISKVAPELEATHVSTVAIQGTMGYLDPEYYTSYQLTAKSDVYSFGVVLLEIISARSAIDFGRGPEDASLVHFGSRSIISEDLTDFIDPLLLKSYHSPIEKESMLSVGRLALNCLEIRAKNRPSMEELWHQLQEIWHQSEGSPDSLENGLFDLPESRGGVPAKTSASLSNASQSQTLGSLGSQEGVEMSSTAFTQPGNTLLR